MTVFTSSVHEESVDDLSTGSIQSESSSPAWNVAVAPFFLPTSLSANTWPLLNAYDALPEKEVYWSLPPAPFNGYSDQAAQSPDQAVPSPDQAAPSPDQAVPSALTEQSEPARPAIKRVPAPVRGKPRAPVVRIVFSSSVLGPMAHTRFCLDYPSECKVRKMQFRGGAMKLTAARRAELIKINAKVNQAIISEPNLAGLAAEKWLVAPNSGECHDYAVTKRHELIARGWPARVLLLGEVIVPSGEHHLVLVVRTHEGDLVADNLSGNILNWSKTGYEWVRIQTSSNPLYWAKLAKTTVYAQLR